MKRAWWLWACLIGGCASGGGLPPPAVYDLGPAVQESQAKALLPGMGLELNVAAWLDSDRIHYRLLYDHPERVREYSLSRWAAPPSVLLAQRLNRVLRGGATAAGSRCTLNLEIDEFGQHFSSPQRSVGVMQGRIRLLGKSGVLAERPIRVERVAPTQDARGGVSALNAVIEGLEQELSGWMRTGVLPVSRCGEGAAAG